MGRYVVTRRVLLPRECVGWPLRWPLEWPLVGQQESAFLWCLHCECVWRRGMWERAGFSCPGCGAGPLDAWAWGRFRGEVGWVPEPTPGMAFPLYGRDGDHRGRGR